ncbi:hypothetical protein ES703_88678 [subsurface metagenome]
MNSTKPTASDKLNYALRLIKDLPNVLLQHLAELGDIRQRLEELEGRTCTGNTHWRDKNASGKTAKLYVLHRIDEPCPIHGQPKPGQRLRVYIGNKPNKIADALAAIERDNERIHLQQKLNHHEETIERILYRLKNVYYALGHALPDPTPDTGQSPETEETG